MSFKKHQSSSTHNEAVESVITLPRTTRDIGELMSSNHKRDKETAREMLQVILSTVRFLARQGLALRGSNNDVESNLIQLLKLRAEDHPLLTRWMERQTNKYTSHEIQDEMLKIMGRSVLNSILSSIHESTYVSIMVDETNDISNKEQLTLVMRRIDHNLDVYEEFLGMYQIDKTTAESITSTIVDALVRFQIPLTKLRGQCYDGCSTMAGSRNGVAAKVQAMEPKAVFTHCYGHALNLAVGDTIKRCVMLRDCLDTCYELIKLIKWSPKRDAMLRRLKEESCDDAPSIRTLCPTRWTVRAESLKSIMANYTSIQNLWEEALECTSETEMKARIQGVSSQMETFTFYFSLVLAEMILRHTDNLSKTLQNPELASTQAYEIAMLTVKTLQSIRTEANFDLFWDKVELERKQLGVGDPCLPRKRKRPRRFETGRSEGEFHTVPKDFFRQAYFESFDLAISCITDRFDQPGYKTYGKIEQLFLKACADSDNNYEEELSFVTEFYDDLHATNLKSQLKVLKTLYSEKAKDEPPSIRVIKSILQSLTPAQRGILDVVCSAFCILLVIPATNCTSERSFSALRRIKSYLRSTMSQERLNHLMLLYYHQELTDSLDMRLVANEFISTKETRQAVFAKCKF